MLSKITTPWTVLGRGAKRRGSGRVRVATEGSPSTQSVAEDYYGVLGLVMFQNTSLFYCLYEEKTNILCFKIFILE